MLQVRIAVVNTLNQWNGLRTSSNSPARPPQENWVATVEGGAEPDSIALAPSAVEFAGKPIFKAERKPAAPEAGSPFPVYAPKDLYNLSDKELLQVFKEGAADIPSALPGNGASCLSHIDRLKCSTIGYEHRVLLCRQSWKRFVFKSRHAEGTITNAGLIIRHAGLASTS